MHIGQLVKQQVEEQGKTVTWFAAQLSCTRVNVYKIYERTSIDTELLLRISIVLQHNFFTPYVERFREKLQ